MHHVESGNYTLQKYKLPCCKESEKQSMQHQKGKIVFPRISHTCKSRYS